jgi:hypothetical protein
MPVFLDTRGLTKLSIAICARCKRKFPYVDLKPDPNYPGLMVCDEDLDKLDPWRLTPRATEDITLEHARPDVPIYGTAPTPIWIDQPGNNPPVPSPVLIAVPWAPQATYAQGASVTPTNINQNPANTPQQQFVALNAGISGATPPAWPQTDGVLVADGTVQWMSIGWCLDQATGGNQRPTG